MKKLIELKHHKFGKTYITKVAVIYPLKNNGKRYATPMVIPAGGYEKTQEDVLHVFKETTRIENTKLLELV